MPTQEHIVTVKGMDCGSCAATVQKGVSALPGIEMAEVTLTTETLHVRGTADLEAVTKRVEQLGYDVITAEDDRPAPPAPQGIFAYLLSQRETALTLIFAGLLVLSIPLSFVDLPGWAQVAVTALHIVAIGVAGLPIMRKGLQALVLARRVTIDLLMTIATVGAFAIGETGEAAAVVVLFAIGEALESYSADRARASLGSLLALAPEEALRLRGDSEELIPVEDVRPGDRLLVRPGGRVPVDATILEGHSALDEAAITGESMPVERTVGDPVFAGTVNTEGALIVEATRPASESTLNRIAKLVEQAQSQKAPIERWIDRFAAWYTPAVVLLAVGVALVPPLAFGAPFLDPATGGHGWLYRGLALLIVACPCALVISTPVTVVSAISGLAQRGVLIKGGAYLEALSRVTAIAFDKTGTLTEGRPQVLSTRTLACPPNATDCPDCNEMVALAAAVERRSEHPLAEAITTEAQQRGVHRRYRPAEGVTALSGRGVEGTLDGQRVRVGRHALFHEGGTACGSLHAQITEAEQSGETVVLVGRGDEVLGYLTLADTPREASQHALAELKAAYPGLHTIMLTGDNPTTALKVADAVGHIDEVRASLLPAEKLAAVRELESVAMVGDGINDAPALAAADVGIAMGGAGTAQAMETADVVLMRDDLTRLPDAIATSHKARRVIQANIAIALGLKGVVLVLTLVGAASLWLAVLADMGSSLLVTVNGLRLLRGGGPTPEVQSA